MEHKLPCLMLQAQACGESPPVETSLPARLTRKLILWAHSFTPTCLKPMSPPLVREQLSEELLEAAESSPTLGTVVGRKPLKCIS